MDRFQQNVISNLIEKHFFEIFEHIQSRQGHTKLMVENFWVDLREHNHYNNEIHNLNDSYEINGFKFTFSKGSYYEKYCWDVFMEKL